MFKRFPAFFLIIMLDMHEGSSIYSLPPFALASTEIIKQFGQKLNLFCMVCIFKTRKMVNV